MELFETVDRFIIHRREYNESLWCNRVDGRLSLRPGLELAEAWNPVCQGIVYAVIGKLQLYPGCDWRLLLVSEQTLAGFLPGGHEVYRIDKIVVLPLTPEGKPTELELKQCPQHPNTSGKNAKQDGVQQRAIQQSWRDFKSTASNQIRGMKGMALVKDVKEKEKQERRLLEEVERMFNDSDSFFYSPTGDLSNSVQRQSSGLIDKSLPLWKQTDDRFFWNKHMLNDIISSEEKCKDLWIQPIIQGFFQAHRCHLNLFDKITQFQRPGDEESSEDEEDGFIFYEEFKTGQNLKPDEYDLVVISRRSRHRAGTRYKRRGVDSDGHVANYVETEQIICVTDHTVSFLQIRGSVPVYWSQPGYKYRPPPQVRDDKDGETARAFKSHFEQEIALYQKQVIISLIEQSPREKIIGDAFIKNILALDSPNLVYITFDFHEHCRGMKFENIGILIDAIEDIINEMKFCWVDAKGVIETQQSAFRVNCMDCLDRTNVIEATIARTVLIKLLKRLGRLLPDETLPSCCKRIHNVLWANNGDAISRQYAGTAAMKGDFTRTGERKITGVMKDGYNSANRYYLNRFKDSYRQFVIDMMLGTTLTEDFAIFDDENANKASQDDDCWTSEKEEAIAQMVLQSQLALLPPEEECLGGWALVEPFAYSESDGAEDEDVILLLTHEAYYIARYDDSVEQIVSYERIPVVELDKIEIGPEFNFFQGRYMFMRIYRKCGRNVGYFYTLRAIQNRSVNEAKAILLSITELFAAVARLYEIQLRVQECIIDKKRSKPPPLVIPLTSKRRLNSTGDLISDKAGHEQARKLSKDRPLSMEIPSVVVEELSEYERKDTSDRHNDSVPNSPPMHKSSSDSAIVNRMKDRPSPTNHAYSEVRSDQGGKSRMDNIFRKTKTVLSAGGTKARSGLQSFARYAKSGELGKTSTEDQVDISCESPQSSNAVVPKKTGFSSAALKDPFSKIKGKINNVRLGNQSPEEDRLSRSLFPELKNRISTALLSPKVRRKAGPRVLTEEEKEIRRNCRTPIIEI